MAQDKKLKSQQNKLAILQFLSRFGWLTAPMVAALVWPTSAQSQAMARRTLAGMLNSKWILKRPLVEGLDCFTLSATGTRILHEQTGIKASSGASLLLGNPIHRACGNWYLIEQINLGLQVWTEHEIQSGHAPLQRVCGKVPDGLVATEYGLLWVEVENAWKNRAEREKILHFCTTHLPSSSLQQMAEIAPELHLFRVVIVGTAPESLKAIVRTCSEAYDNNSLSESQAADIELVYQPLTARLTPSQNAISGSLWYEALNVF
ncbi:hypothetical protein [Comamonas sp. HJ-2]